MNRIEYWQLKTPLLQVLATLETAEGATEGQESGQARLVREQTEAMLADLEELWAHWQEQTRLRWAPRQDDDMDDWGSDDAPAEVSDDEVDEMFAEMERKRVEQHD